jgi:hypothetical protein
MGRTLHARLALAAAAPMAACPPFARGRSTWRGSTSDAYMGPPVGLSGDDWARESSFRYALNHAPRAVTHEPRLADGDHTVKIEIVASQHLTPVHRHLALGGVTTPIDLADSVPR